MKLKIPSSCQDIRAAVKNRFIKDILLIVAVRVILFLPAYFYGYYSRPVNIFGVILVEVICLFPFIKTRFWKWFTSARAFEGEVIAVKHRRGNKVTKTPLIVSKQTPTKAMKKTPVAGRFRQVIKVNIQKIRVRLPNGKIRRVRYVCDEGLRQPEYEVGDHVRHYYGTKYMQKIPNHEKKADQSSVMCVMCGTSNPYGADRCAYCEVSLIDPDTN